MRERFWIRLLLTGSAVAFLQGTASLGAERHNSAPESERHARAVFDCLLPVVYSSGAAVRLYYRGVCPSNAFDPVPFPSVKLQRALSGKTGLAAVREIFQRDGNVKVTADSTGIIRIWIGEVPTAILQTRIPRLNLNATAQYNPDWVFDAMLEAKEMSAAGQSLGYTTPVTVGGGSLLIPDKRLPHLPATIRNMSAERTLDKVARNWAGRIVVVYGTCAGPQKPDRGRLYILKSEGQMAWSSDYGPNR